MRVDTIRQRVLGCEDREGGAHSERAEREERRTDVGQGSNQQQNRRVTRNYVSGLGQMLNPHNSCFASASIQCLSAIEVDLHLNNTIARPTNHRNLDQVNHCPLHKYLYWHMVV